MFMKTIPYAITTEKELRDYIGDLESNTKRMETDIKQSFVKLKNEIKPATILKRAVHSIVNKVKGRHKSEEIKLETNSSIKNLLSKRSAVRPTTITANESGTIIT